jgi:transcriptional regulator with XRE-family HTH domain
MAARESFGQFVTRILNEKRLSLSDVERRTQKAISDSYLSYIIQDKGVNLTLRKLKALAQGLDVPEAMILEAACGIPLVDATKGPASEFAHAMYKYEHLSNQDKTDLLPMLQILCREIDRRLSANNGDQPYDGSASQS